MTKNLLLSITQLHNGHNASSKPRIDIEHFLQQQDNFIVKNLAIDRDSKIAKAIYLYWKLGHNFKSYLLDIKPNNIFIQYPAYSKVLMNKVIKIIQNNLPNTKIYFIIHDVESLRLYKDDPSFKAVEINLLNSVDGLIVHSQPMQDWLSKNNVKTKMVTLGLFDYQANIKPHVQTTYNKSICFAGNLKKAQFLNELNFKDINLHVFGDGLDLNNANHILYEGSKEPDELSKFLNYNFGLIWDGKSTKTCTGVSGEYLKYNAPHKASLYLSSGLPIVTWKQSAIGKFAVKNNIGITVDSLDDLDNALNKLSKENYLSMAKNVQSFAIKLHEGDFIKQAVRKLTTE